MKQKRLNPRYYMCYLKKNLGFEFVYDSERKIVWLSKGKKPIINFLSLSSHFSLKQIKDMAIIYTYRPMYFCKYIK